MPAKVLAKAKQLGIHNDCLSAGPYGACSECHANILLAFDFFYGDVDAETLRTQIATDLLTEGTLDDEF